MEIPNRHQRRAAASILKQGPPINASLQVPIIGAQRLAVTNIAIGAFLAFFTPSEQWFRTIEGVPNGARLQKMMLDPKTGVLSLLWEHESFPPVQADGSIWQIVVKFAALDLTAAGTATTTAAEDASAAVDASEPGAGT